MLEFDDPMEGEGEDGEVLLLSVLRTEDTSPRPDRCLSPILVVCTFTSEK